MMINLILKNILLTVTLIIVFTILFSLYTFYMSVKPGRWPMQFTPESFDLKYENVSLPEII